MRKRRRERLWQRNRGSDRLASREKKEEKKGHFSLPVLERGRLMEG